MGSTVIQVEPPVRRSAAISNVLAPRVTFDLLRVSLVVLIIMNVSRIHQRFGVLSAIRPGVLFVGLAFIAAFARPKSLARWGWTRSWQAQAVAGITVVTLGSIVFGISQGAAFYGFSTYFWKVLVFAFLLFAAIRDVRDLSLFVWAYVIGAGILVWMALFVFGLSVANTGVARLDNLETWDANDICVLLLIGLGLGLLLIQTAGTKGKIAAAAIVIGIGAAIARSGSRGGFLGLAVMVLAYLLSMQGTSIARRVGLVLVLTIGLIVAAPANYWKQMQTISEVRSDYNWDQEQGRRQLALRGMQYMLSYPLFGLGIGNFGRAEGMDSDFARRAEESGRRFRWSAAHNSYVQAGAELGVPGFLLFTGLVVGCIVAPWRLRRRIPSAWKKGDYDQRFMFHAARYMPLAALGFAVPATFVSFAYSEPIYILAAMTAALTAAVHKRRGRDNPRPRRGSFPVAARTV